MESKKEELRYRHFSHDHWLDYTKLQPHGHGTCSGCKQKISPGNFCYNCKLCRFYLHQVCFNMPENVTHPSDPNHNLTLESFPTLSKVPISCKACETPIKGFYYHCSKCKDYYHTLCLAAPLSMKTPSHRHSLNIEFVPVYEFQCDLCDKPSYSGWVYHCNLCEFDAHLSCVLTNKGSSQKHNLLPNHAIRANERWDELMELLSGLNLTQNQDQSFLLSTDQDHANFSIQLSDACFSIDFQKSLLGNDEDHKMPAGKGSVLREVAIPEDYQEQVFEESKRSEKGRGSSNGRKSISVSSGGIGAHIWTELEQDTEKRNSKAGDKRSAESDIGRSSCLNLSKMIMCFLNIGHSKGHGGKLSSPRK